MGLGLSRRRPFQSRQWFPSQETGHSGGGAVRSERFSPWRPWWLPVKTPFSRPSQIDFDRPGNLPRSSSQPACASCWSSSIPWFRPTPAGNPKSSEKRLTPKTAASPRGGRLRWVSIRNGDASPLSRETGCEQQRSLNRGGGAGVGEHRVVVISVASRSPRGTRNLEYGASAVFPCGQNPPSIQTTTLPHKSTSPENTVRCPDWDQSVRPTNNRRGQVVPVRELAGSGNARLWPHGKTAEAPYSKFAQPRPIDSPDRRTTAGARSFLCGSSSVRGTPGCGRMGRRRKRRTPG